MKVERGQEGEGRDEEEVNMFELKELALQRKGVKGTHNER